MPYVRFGGEEGLKRAGSGAGRWAHTYSIVAYDAEQREWGVAVQSHYLNVGAVVPWAAAGVGAVATQSHVEVSYGPLGLQLMRAGKSAQQALDSLVRTDPGAARRQVAMIDAAGNVAVHTGERCIPQAGQRTGAHFSVQANMMLKDTVWDAMAEAYDSAKGDLAERMMVALEAAEAEGGDIRGKQSAALIVVRGEMTGTPWSDASKPFDLRVDDSTEPLPELRRLVAVTRAYHYASEASAIMANTTLGERRFEMARQKFGQARELRYSMPGNNELDFWYALDLARNGKWHEAEPLFREIFAAEPAWRNLVPRVLGVNEEPVESAFVERIVGL